MNEEAYEHRLRSLLANKPTGESHFCIYCARLTGEAIFVYIVHGYNETLKISIEYFYNLTTSL